MTYLFLGDIAFYIKIASGILSILLLITILILLINYLSFDSDKEAAKALQYGFFLKKAFIIGLVCICVYVIIPSKDTFLAMALAMIDTETKKIILERQREAYELEKLKILHPTCR